MWLEAEGSWPGGFKNKHMRNPDPLKDPKNGAPNIPPSFPNVVMGSHWGGVPFFGSCRGSGNKGNYCIGIGFIDSTHLFPANHQTD